MNDKREVRMFVSDLEVRNNEETNDMLIEGYAVKFDSPATHGFTEIIDRHAFDRCDMRDVSLKYNHNDSFLILARTRNNSLELIIDDVGLKVRATLIDTTSNVDVYKCLKAGLLDKMSFAFTVSEESWNLETDTRTILGIDCLYDVSIVDIPFYDTTEIYARALNRLNSEKEKVKNTITSLKHRKRKLALKLKLRNF